MYSCCVIIFTKENIHAFLLTNEYCIAPLIMMHLVVPNINMLTPKIDESILKEYIFHFL